MFLFISIISSLFGFWFLLNLFFLLNLLILELSSSLSWAWVLSLTSWDSSVEASSLTSGVTTSLWLSSSLTISVGMISFIGASSSSNLGASWLSTLAPSSTSIKVGWSSSTLFSSVLGLTFFLGFLWSFLFGFSTFSTSTELASSLLSSFTSVGSAGLTLTLITFLVFTTLFFLLFSRFYYILILVLCLGYNIKLLLLNI